MCERITFPVEVWESCAIHGELKLLAAGPRRTASFSPGPRRQTKTSPTRQSMLSVGDAAACLIAFVSPGSDVSCNHLGMRVCVMAVLSVPQQRGSFRLFGRFFSPPDSRGEKKKDKCYLSACEEQLLFRELGVTLRDPSCGSPARRDSKCFLLLDSSTLGALGGMKY